MRIEVVVYFCSIGLLGYFYESIKNYFNNSIFFVTIVVIAYFALVLMVAYVLKRLVDNKRNEGD